MRKRSSDGRPTCSVATYQSADRDHEPARAILCAPRTPSERFFETFVQSSTKPSAALASAVPSTASARRAS